MLFLCRMTYNKYNTAIKTSVALNIHNQILPASFIDSLPPSTISGWRNLNPEQFVGYQFANQIESNLDDVHVMFDERLKLFKNSFFAFARLYLTILDSIGKNDFQKMIRKNKYVFVDLIDNLSKAFDNKQIEKSICKFLRITPKMFKSWKSYRKYQCSESLSNICFKRLPQQISKLEIKKLKEYLANGKYPFWSVGTIWAQAIRDKASSMSSSTWYRYAKKLGLMEVRKLAKKCRKQGSVKAKKVNEIWHMDVSYFITSNNVKLYVYSVLDNLSRKLVDLSYSSVLSAELRTASLRRAIYNEFDVNIKDQEIDLIVDGGSENNNSTVHEFIRKCKVNINKKIALKDVRYSNSMIEASFKIMKQAYFRYQPIHSRDFGKHLTHFKHDYNYVRPHHAHTLYTPSEISNNQSLLDVKPILEKVNHERLEANRNFCCKIDL